MITRPGPVPPDLRRRRYSFAVEYYRLLSWSHRAVLAALWWALPDPLAATRRELRRARLAPAAVERGDPVSGPLGAGRFVGRHPTSGAPIVAWDAEAYAAMCEAYDAENTYRIAAHAALAGAYGLDTETCAALALRIDKAIRWIMAIGTILPGLTTLATGEGAVAAGVAMALGAALTGAGIGGLVAASFMLVTPIAVASALAAGGRAARLARAAVAADDAGRSSAAAVVAQQQQAAVEPQRR